MDELEAEKVKRVRVQPYCKQETDQQTGLVRLHYFVVAAGLTQAGEVLVARLHTGSAWRHEEEDARQREENNEAAGELLERHLGSSGFEVRPGIVAASSESETLATTYLWKFEGGKLVASDRVGLALQELEQALQGKQGR